MIANTKVEGMDFLPLEYEYIHQLQNPYFALTGKELELKQTTDANKN